jgi:imidazolonepropionase-like amidohydrolase
MADHDRPVRLDRRKFLQLTASASFAAFLAACGGDAAPTRPRVSSGGDGPDAVSAEPTTAGSPSSGGAASSPTSPGSGTSPSPSTASVPAPGGRRTLYRGANLATGRSALLERGISVLVANGRIAWIRPTDAEEDPGPTAGLVIVDARGKTIVPGLVDGHSHVVLPGGVDYRARLGDPPAVLAAVAERNGRLAWQAGVRWLRDVGSPIGVDPVDGRHRALSLGVRDRWRGQANRPRIRTAGTWIAAPGGRPAGSGLAIGDPAKLPAAALGQLREGADLVKLYVQAPGGGSPWSAAEIRRVVTAVHAAGARVAAHVMDLGAARAAVDGGVDAVDHGFQIDADLARAMAAQGTFLVTTITVPKTWLGFARSAPGSSFASSAGLAYSNRILRDALASARIAHRAGVKIVAGTDFGGGGARAGVLAGEVESLVEAGLEPWEALGAATWRGGELLGEPDAGVVREGAPADFSLVNGDPLSDPSVLWRIWRAA